MSWPIGYAPSRSFTTSADGTIRGRDDEIVAPAGWVELPAPPDRPDTPVFVRVRIAPDASGRPYIYAEDVRVGPTRYPSVHRLALAEGAGWIAYLTRALPEALRGGADTRSAAVRTPSETEPTAVATDADDTGRFPAVHERRAEALLAEDERATDAPASSSTSGVRPRTVLVVEDDQPVRDALVDALGAEGHRAVGVPHGGVALAYLSACRNPVDVILLDMHMPEVDGWTFLDARRRDPALAAIPVVVLSAHAGPMRRVPHVGVALVLPKPVEPGDVLEAVAHCAAAR